MSATNPYAPPKAALDDLLSGECWRDGKVLIVRPHGALPHRCVKCNAPAETPIKKRKVHWHHPALYLLILVSILIYAVVALVVRKKAEIQPGLCAVHQKRRTRGLFLLWGGLLGGLALIFGGLANDADGIAIIGFLLLLAGLVSGSFMARLLTPNRIDNDFVRLRGAGKAFLDSLPAFPGR